MPESSSSREAELRQQLQEKDEQLRQAQAKIALLEAKIDLLVRKLFGAKSEKIDSAQLLLLLQGLDAPGKASEPVAAEEPRRSKAPSPPRERGPRLPEHLPVIEEVIVPDLVKTAPEQWRRIGEEVSERLDYEPARFLRRRTVRPKYVQRGVLETVPVIAPLPPCLLENSIVTPGLLAQILVAKYCDHLPLYRQETIYRTRHGVELSRQNMAQWVSLGADWLGLIFKEIQAGVMSAGYVQIDETPIRYLAPGCGKTGTGYFWTVHRPRHDVVFHWHTSRAADCLEKIVPMNFTGIIQRDGYAAYESFARRRPSQIQLAGCWTHARRKFHEASTTAPREAGLVLHLLQNLYRCEGGLRSTRAGPKLRIIARHHEAKPVIDRLHWLLRHWQSQSRFLPQSLMGQAIAYMLGQWQVLQVYLEDGRVEIDTNLVENCIRPTAVGKKNWLFIGAAEAGDRSAIIYTVIESCRRRNIDPYAYLRDVFTRLPSATTAQIKDLAPEAWAKAQRRAAFQPAA